MSHTCVTEEQNNDVRYVAMDSLPKVDVINASKTRIIAAKLVAELVRTSLGPHGLDRMLSSKFQPVSIIETDTLLTKENIMHELAISEVQSIAELGYAATNDVKKITGIGISTTIIDLMRDFRSDSRTERCPDDTKVYVLKDPSRAYELFKREHSLKVSESLPILESILGELDVEYANKIKPLFAGLNRLDGRLKIKYLEAYRIFHSKPCDKDSWKKWIETTEKINKFSDILEIMTMQLEAAKSDPKILKTVISNINEQFKMIIDKMIQDL